MPKKPLYFMVPGADGKLHKTLSKKIKRFPRRPEGNLVKLSRDAKLVARAANGEVPRGYDRLDKKWRKVAKLVASGEYTVKDVCAKFHIDTDTFYRRRKAHKLFREYLRHCFQKSLQEIDRTLDQHTVRAARIVGQAMDSSDPYFRYAAAEKHLKGRGLYSQNHEVRQKVSGNIKIDHDPGATVGLDKELIAMFIQGLVEVSRGKPLDANAIDVEAMEVKALTDGDSQVQTSV